MRHKIYVAVLSLAEVRKELSIRLLEMSHDNRFYVKIKYHGLRPSSFNRNNIVEHFLKSDCDYLITIDNDTVPRKNPLDLVFHDKDIIGLPYPQVKGNEIGWLVMDKEGDRYRQVNLKNKKGLIECDAVGSGCMLIARRVLEAVVVPFERKWVDGVPVKGHDFYFCDKAKKMGFKVFTHLDYVCSHYKTVDLLQVLEWIGGKNE